MADSDRSPAEVKQPESRLAQHLQSSQRYIDALLDELAPLSDYTHAALDEADERNGLQKLRDGA
jgi:hypothetical protein